MSHETSSIGLKKMLTNQIKDTILAALPEATVYVIDPHNDGEHFESIVIAPEFEGLSLVKQHKLVMGPLTEAFASSVHALALKTFSPSKWETKKHLYKV